VTLPDLDRVIHSSPSPVILLEGRREIPPEFALHELGHVLRACHRPLRRNAFRVAFGQASPRDYHEIHRREAWKTASTLRLSWWPGPHRPAGQPSHYGMTAGGEERFCELIALMHAHGGFAQQPPDDLDDLWRTCWNDGLARMV
jgi:hypothetical protein